MSKNKITILIVDDTVYNLKVLKIMLSNQGYIVLEATDGIKAIEIAIANTPDLILLDIKMPSMDGYQVCTNLKSNPITQQIPVIFISAIESIEEKIEAFTVGGIDFINKPFHLVEVLARVETHLRISSLQTQLLEQAKLLESRNMSLQREISHLTGFNWELYEELKIAIDKSQLKLFYQPIVNFKSNLITGFEALIRWDHPQKGFLNPSDFIDFVEATDLIYPIGRWVIETACQQLKIWQQLSPKYLDLTINVNVSTKQLADFKFLQYIREIVQDSQINPHCLKLEITESTVMGDLDRTLKILHQLKDLDVQFCIDDFGTGYSSLRRLTDFPIDILKIDRSFIVNEEWVIVKAIGTLAFTLGKSVVVEGIETLLELEILKSLFSSYLNISYGQGYLFAKPLDYQAASDLLLSKAEQTECNYTNNS